MTLRYLLCLSVVLTTFGAHAYFESKKAFGHPQEMNGIYFENYRDFATKWHLVTVRFRQDSGELRLTYANDLAFKAMKSLKPSYPDGAMFGKVAFTTENDPSFQSSKMPSATKRFQLMLKDRKKYQGSDGWGYALFDNDGQLFNEDVQKKTESCVACHRLVPERDYVFSRPVSLLSGMQSLSSSTSLEKISSKEFEYLKVNVKESAEDLKEFLRDYAYFLDLQGSLKKHGFSGTLDEILPTLLQKAKLTGTPAALILDSSNFSLAIPKLKSKVCEGQGELRSFQTVVKFNSKLVRSTEVCL